MNNSKYTPPFRVGRKQNRAVLDSNGLEVVIFKVGDEDLAEEFCNYLNTKDFVDITKLSEIKFKILKTCYSAIKYADENKIKSAYENHFKTDDWVEETCTPDYGNITIKPSGISTDLYVCGKECIDFALDP